MILEIAISIQGLGAHPAFLFPINPQERRSMLRSVTCILMALVTTWTVEARAADQGFRRAAVESYQQRLQQAGIPVLFRSASSVQAFGGSYLTVGAGLAGGSSMALLGDSTRSGKCEVIYDADGDSYRRYRLPEFGKLTTYYGLSLTNGDDALFVFDLYRSVGQCVAAFYPSPLKVDDLLARMGFGADRLADLPPHRQEEARRYGNMLLRRYERGVLAAFATLVYLRADGTTALPQIIADLDHLGGFWLNRPDLDDSSLIESAIRRYSDRAPNTDDMAELMKIAREVSLEALGTFDLAQVMANVAANDKVRRILAYGMYDTAHREDVLEGRGALPGLMDLFTNGPFDLSLQKTIADYLATVKALHAIPDISIAAANKAMADVLLSPNALAKMTMMQFFRAYNDAIVTGVSSQLTMNGAKLLLVRPNGALFIFGPNGERLQQ
jgi:hypothetical protein